MDKKNKNQKHPLAGIRENRLRLKKSFQYIRDSLMSPQTEAFTADKVKKVDNLLENLRWRIDHVERTEKDPDEVILRSFRDLINEIEWRLKELELIREGKSISDENPESRLAREYRRKTGKKD